MWVSLLVKGVIPEPQRKGGKRRWFLNFYTSQFYTPACCVGQHKEEFRGDALAQLHIVVHCYLHNEELFI